MGVSQILYDLNIKNKRNIIYVIGAIVLLIIFNFVYKRIKTHENFTVLTEIQDLATNDENTILNSTNQVKFVNSNIGNYFTGSSTGNTLTDILSDIYSKVNTNTTNIAQNTTNNTADTANISYLQTSNTAVWDIANQALTIANNLSPLPVGTIIAWNQPSVPDATWVICDGSSYSYIDNTGSSPIVANITTPNLLGRFILGDSPSHKLGDTGGEETHKLTIDEMPSHNHNMTNTPGHGGDPNDQARSDNYFNYGSTNNYQGGDQPHNNMPPFYVLTYIMKVFKNVT